MLLVSPLTWDHYHLLLLLPVALLWAWLPHPGARRVVLYLCLAALWAPVMLVWKAGLLYPLGGWVRAEPKTWQVLTVLSYQTYALIVIFILAALPYGEEDDEASLTTTIPPCSGQ